MFHITMETAGSSPFELRKAVRWHDGAFSGHSRPDRADGSAVGVRHAANRLRGVRRAIDHRVTDARWR
jgi:hypothetical protein